ncbi:DUF6879 family protein [Nonomuraea longicatena]|uniref:DUF6879 domain-containing protein n=1 Tax=Nonomuraea longicatena TaxID=83682 RepID=A0ABN1QRZ0_9ACTN
MEELTRDDWIAMFRDTQDAAVHLELRDVYSVPEEEQQIIQWRAGEYDPASDERDREWWLDLMRETTSRGVRVRRARIVSEPVTEYIRYEYAGTPFNIRAGEEVRWLPRRQASRLTLPGNDFWLFDKSMVVFNHFTGDGEWASTETTRDSDAISLCLAAFEAVWAVGIPHGEYKPG